VPLSPPSPGGRLNTAGRQAKHRRAVYQNPETLQVAELAICQSVQNSTYTPQPISYDESHLIH